MSKHEEMDKIRSLINNCRKCPLWESRINPVPGEGDYDAEIFFIGEAPGYNEDQQGHPFVGKAGKILDELLASINLKRTEVFIANILKCRPPENRNPYQEEIETCTEYLDRQIEIIHPSIIVPLGNFACEYIFKKFGLPYEKISKIHGKVIKINTLMGTLRIVPLYHPAVATYNPQTKTILLQDFQTIKTLIPSVKPPKENMVT